MEELKENTLYTLTYHSGTIRIMECISHIEGTKYRFYVQDSGMISEVFYGNHANIREIDISKLKEIKER